MLKQSSGDATSLDKTTTKSCEHNVFFCNRARYAANTSSLVNENLQSFKSCLEIRYQICRVVKPMTLIVFFAGTREDNLLANDIFLWQVCKHEEAEIWLNDHRSNSLRCSNPRHSALECVHTLPSLKYIAAAVFGLKDDQQCQGNAFLHLILTFFSTTGDLIMMIV